MRSRIRSIFALNPATLTLISVVAGVLLLQAQVPLLESVERWSYDLRVRSRGTLEPSPAVVLAVVDEASLDVEGRWPWPRSRLAELVDYLSDDGAVVIGFDIGFLEPDENSHLETLDALAQKVGELGLADPGLTGLLAAQRRAADHDQRLAAAIERSAAPVVLGYFFHMDAAAVAGRLDEAEIQAQLARIADSKYPFILYQDPDVDLELPTAYAPEANLPLLGEAAAGAGSFTLRPDRDGVVRWLPLVIKAGEELFPPLAVVTAWHALGRPRLMVEVGPYGVEGIRLGERFIPTDESGQLLINYMGPAGTFPHVSISDILAGRYPQGAFAGRVVIVGATATGTYDMRATPLGPVFPGPEIHASVLDNILTERFLTRPQWWWIFDLLAIAVLGGLVGLALPRLGVVSGLLATFALCGLHLLLSEWLFVERGIWINVTYPVLVAGGNYLAITVRAYVAERRERSRVVGAFGRYVAPVVVEQMLEDPERLELGGEEKVLSVLFSDLQGFTAASERFQPHEMVEFLSEYYARMTEEVFAEAGTLKEYVGDELMAIFGAPIEQEDHAVRACAAALRMRATRHALSAAWQRIGRPALRARTGINSGLMLVGNLGSEYRISYGVVGDAVNLGSRLEGLCKQYGTEILIGESTAAFVEKDFHLREIDLVQVVGRERPVRVYELLSSASEPLPAATERLLDLYGRALDAYRGRDWSRAERLFLDCLQSEPEDGAAQALLGRCRHYRASPPPDDWDGTHQALEK